MKPTIIEGSLCLVTEAGEVYARDIDAYISYAGNNYNVLTLARTGEWTLDGNVASCDNVTITFLTCGDGVLARTTLTNSGERLEDGEFYSFVCTLTGVPDVAQCTRLTYDCGNYVNEMRSQIDTVRTVRGSRYESADNVVYVDKGGRCGTFGYVTFDKFFGAVTVGGDGRMAAHHWLEQHTLDTGASVTSDLVLITPSGDPVHEAFPALANLILSLSGEKTTEKKTPVGFCTWYYYAQGINTEIMRENMDVLDEMKPDVPVEIIQVDDGWFDRWGSWQPKDNFGRDMKAFADEVKSRGYIPGIWVAPFGADKESEIFKEHPEYFVQMKCGQPWPWPAFDFSVPESREYIRNLFHTLSYDWGYRYIKMDIITPRLAPAVHRDPEFSTVRNYKEGLRIMRESVTPDTFLLACTAPLAPAAGLVDGMRVSCDVFERWESLRDVFNSVIKRWYTNGVYYINDADCLLGRTKDEEDEQCWRLCTRTDGEIRTYVTAMAASGGALMLSDKMPLLKPEQKKLISKLFPLNTKAAVPLDLMESFIPGVLDFGTRHGTRTVALINWNDAPQTMTVPGSGGKLAFEFWSKSFDTPAGDITVKLEPHGCRVFFLTDKTDACETVVGTDGTVVMDIADGKKNKPDETLYIARKTADGYEIITK